MIVNYLRHYQMMSSSQRAYSIGSERAKKKWQMRTKDQRVQKKANTALAKRVAGQGIAFRDKEIVSLCLENFQHLAR